jgi:hypothetical protein
MGNQDLKTLVKRKTKMTKKRNPGKKLILTEMKFLAKSFKKLNTLLEKTL